ncbi:DUF3108 domain-containing protein [Acetobacter indonesiensis]|uniref:DUF3108 domain-containing protein n=1 Tax=Acetobacter indonesiensis TaxID=104101 RepID=UPI0020A28961|nr:DUF3108 domain-containing protein [Acetobacter indonesiensis]MCP1229486.1 DUF3108 domain-containing protein [Acetobacter indonesiensis]
MLRSRLVFGLTAFKRVLSVACLAGALAFLPMRYSEAAEQTPQTEVKYLVFVHGLHVMDIQATYRLDDTQYGVGAHVKTAGLFGMFMKTDLTLQARGRFAGGKIEPESFETAGWSRKRTRHAIIHYQDSTPQVALMDPVETDREPVTDEERKGAVDTLAMLMGLLHDVRSTQSCRGQEKVFDGLRLTTLSFQSAGEQKIPSGGPLDWGEAALRCNFVGQQIKGFKFSSEKSKLRNPQPGRAWFEKIGTMGLVAVRIELDHPKLGHITVLLDGAPRQF